MPASVEIVFSFYQLVELNHVAAVPASVEIGFSFS